MSRLKNCGRNINNTKNSYSIKIFEYLFSLNLKFNFICKLDQKTCCFFFEEKCLLMQWPLQIHRCTIYLRISFIQCRRFRLQAIMMIFIFLFYITTVWKTKDISQDNDDWVKFPKRQFSFAFESEQILPKVRCWNRQPRP